LIAPEIKEDAMPCTLLLREENEKGRHGGRERERERVMPWLPAHCR